MKVTVCFDSIRVVVPCADGLLPVSDLIERAVHRYRKAAGKPSSHWINVNFFTSSEGGILDPNDRLKDVVDDKEHIIAIFEEEQADSMPQHSGGDGTSASSMSASSPEMFHEDCLIYEKVFEPLRCSAVITAQDFDLGTSLTVRRGSEPVLCSDELINGTVRQEQNNGKGSTFQVPSRYSNGAVDAANHLHPLPVNVVDGVTDKISCLK